MKNLLLIFAFSLIASFNADAIEIGLKPEGVDLDVTVIERTPRYPNYLVKYEASSTKFYIHPDQKDVKKRWPDKGEEVTFIGKIANKGTKYSQSFEYIWLLDGKKTGNTGTIEGLEPGEYAEVSMKWKWDMKPHVVQLIADPDNKITETFEQNNQLVHDTLAKVMHLKVSHDTFDRMNNCTNLVGTYSCEDQLNWYMTHMNEMFKNAIYPSLPNGSRERVRAEFLFVKDANEFREWYEKQGGQSFAGFDGGWWHDYGENTANWCQKIDWGLPHELGHQLGLIDLYRLDLGMDLNLAPDEDNDPIMIGRGCDHIGMMRGHGPVPWSEHSALAMDTHFMKRRGFFGGYLVALPEKIYIQLLDNKSYPAEGAKITAYQTKESMIPNEIVFEGATEKDGKFLLPNRSINQPRHITELGYEYHDNPWGAINIVGANGVLLFKIESKGHTEFKWLEITHANLAYWRGQKEEYTHVFQTHIPHSTMPSAPKNVIAQCILSDKGIFSGVKVTWDKVPNSPALEGRQPFSEIDLGTKTTKSTTQYRIWRALPPNYNWESIGIVWDRDASEFIDKTISPGMVRYAVTSINTSGEESGFSNYYGYSVLGSPTGITALKNGRLLLADGEGKQNALVFLKPNGSTIGPWNSVHCHSYSRDVAVAKDGMVAFTDSPDGYDPKNCGFWLRQWDSYVKGTPVKKELGNGENQISRPQGISFDDDGNIILTDAGNNRIDCYNRKGERIWRVDNVKALRDKVNFSEPSKAIMWKGFLVIADTGNDRAVLIYYAQRDVQGPIVLNGLKAPKYVASDSKGRLLVSDTGNNRVLIYDHDEKQIKQIADFAGTDNKKLSSPIGITEIETGKYAIVDAGNKRLVFVDEKELLAGN